MAHDTRPTMFSRPSTRSSSKSSLTLDLSILPPLAQPTPPSNTLLFTNLQNPDIFQADNLQTIRNLVEHVAPIHAWAPLKSFRRIVVSFFDEDAAIKVRSVWDGEAIMGERCRVYFGQPTPLHAGPDKHLALPDAGKLFFISPPPSPPHGWERKLEDAPNKVVHAEDLADALARLRHSNEPNGLHVNSGHSPISPADSNAPGGFGSRQRSRSSTLIFQPQEGGTSPNLPCVLVDDMTDDTEEPSPMDPMPIRAHTTRPPVELMEE